jgi:hypothetical protein
VDKFLAECHSTGLIIHDQNFYPGAWQENFQFCIWHIKIDIGDWKREMYDDCLGSLLPCQFRRVIISVALAELENPGAAKICPPVVPVRAKNVVNALSICLQ